MKEKELTKLGLLESEAKVYLALLKTGQSSAGVIAKQTKLNRVSVYKALEKLSQEGLISSVILANTKMFQANNPQSLQDLISKKQQELLKIKNQLPSLNKLFNKTKKEVSVKIYQGIKGAKAIWEEILNQSKKQDEWLILGAPKSAELLGGYFKDFNKRRAKLKVKMKIIYNQDAKDLIKIRKQQPLTEVRVMPKEYLTPASIEIINNKTLIVIYQPELIVFLIESKETADSFKQYFKMLWKIAKRK